MTTIDEMVARWNDPTARPLFKGLLINEDGCCCAQGDVLRVSGWTDEQLRNVSQRKADREVAKLLGISLTHAVVLRYINDSADGCPQNVLAHPERILGDQAQRVLAFWRHLENMGTVAWAAVGTAATGRAATRTTAWTAAFTAAVATSGTAARTAFDAVDAASAGAAPWAAAGAAPWAASAATSEIQGAALLDKFFFLPLFGIADPAELDAGEAK